MKLEKPVPILRMFDEDMTKEFYVDFLGFRIDWENRFEPGSPLYMQVSHGECVLHLTGHFGDSSPGSGLRIEISHVVGNARSHDHGSFRQSDHLHAARGR